MLHFASLKKKKYYKDVYITNLMHRIETKIFMVVYEGSKQKIGNENLYYNKEGSASVFEA